MMGFIVLGLGIFLSIIGLILIFAPEILKKISDVMNKSVFSGDKSVYLHRYVMAAICILVGLVLVYMYIKYGHWMV
jgi:hypothetical protein